MASVPSGAESAFDGGNLVFGQLAAIAALISKGYIVGFGTRIWTFGEAGLLIGVGIISYATLLGRIEAVAGPHSTS